MLSGAIQCDKMRNEMWGGSAIASLNSIVLCSVDSVFGWFSIIDLRGGFFSCVFVISLYDLVSFYLCYEQIIG